MYKPSSKLIWILVLLLSGPGLKHCDVLPEEDLLIENLELHRLTILPKHSVSSDQIKVIEKICGNETEVILTFEGMQINYKRYFNSLMMMPCRPELDTTLIGPLNPGEYQLVHCMIDKNHLITDSIYLLDTIPLLVK